MIAGIAALLVPAAAEAHWVVDGRGWGHGVGMSQWGARGYAAHGKSHGWILDHYYKHTNIRSAGGDRIEVLLQTGQGKVDFTDAGRACGRRLNADRRYRFDLSGGQVVLRGGGKRIAGCGGAGTAHGDVVHLLGKGRYRGEIRAVRQSSGMAVVNRLGLEGYVKGCVPNEVPPEWPHAALRAQAVAARSYGLTQRRPGLFDVYDDTRSQVYGGAGTETDRTNAAVTDTEGKVVKHDGSIATTYYFSTSGGRTENSEFGFSGGSPRPYLKSVKDEYDGASPHHEWSANFSESEMRSKLSGLFSGRLVRIDVTRRGRSPRIVSARVVGSSGSSTVSGATLQFRLGTRSTWMHFDRR